MKALNSLSRRPINRINRINRKGLVLTLLAFPLLLVNCSSKTAGTSPVEVGPVSWLRDYTEAVQVAGEEKKPIFALFQEVPG